MGDDNGAFPEVRDFLDGGRLHAQQHIGTRQGSGAIGEDFGIRKRGIGKICRFSGRFLHDDLRPTGFEFLRDFRSQRNAALAFGGFAEYGNDDRHGFPSMKSGEHPSPTWQSR